MTEVDLANALNPLVGNRVYPDLATDPNVVTPFIVYQQVGGRPVNFIEGQGSELKNARVQISVWGKTRLEVMTLIRQVENTMVQSPLFGTVEGGAIAAYSESTKMRGAHQDFSVWFD